MLAAALVIVTLAAPAESSPSPAPGPGLPEHHEELEVVAKDEIDMAEARRLYDAGKQAAGTVRWSEAIRFFAQAYRLSASPGLLYSLGRAHYELYFGEGRDPVQLRLALLRLRQYLERSPSGKSRDLARKYIDELEPYVTVLEGFDETPEITRLMVHSPVDSAIVSVDGGKPRPAPVSIDVEPGTHRVTVRADGFRDAVRMVEVPEGATVPLEVALAEREAELTVSGPKGADVYVDGQRSGQLPMQAAIGLPAGSHQVAVAQTGRTPFVRVVDLGRGESRDVRVDLPITTQRKIAFAAIGIGGGSLLAAGTLTGLSLAAQARGEDIRRERETTGVSQERFEEGQDAWHQRDAFRTAAIATGVVGGVLIGTGLVLYFTDKPRLGDRLYRPERSREKRSLSLTPVVGPAWTGTSLSGRF